MNLNEQKKPRGETVTETIVALTIMAFGIALASALLANSLRNIGASKNRVVAINIAREGIEAVRALRDTNWLKFSSNRRQCWNHMPQTLPDTCDASNYTTTEILPDANNGAVGQTANYIVYRDKDSRWRLAPQTLAAGTDNSKLSLVDIDPAKDSDGDGDPALGKINDSDIYNHLGPADSMPAPNIPAAAPNDTRSQAKPTDFKRTIKIDYLQNDGTLVSANASPLPDTLNRLRVTSTVTWTEHGTDHTVVLITNLTD